MSAKEVSLRKMILCTVVVVFCILAFLNMMGTLGYIIIKVGRAHQECPHCGESYEECERWLAPRNSHPGNFFCPTVQDKGD